VKQKIKNELKSQIIAGSFRNRMFIIAIGGVLFGIVMFFVFSVNGAFMDTRSNEVTSVVESTVLSSVQQPEEVNVANPIRITIPKINVDAFVTNVGITADGAMDIPERPGDVGWYELGPRPGEIGSAVVAGHYGEWKNGDLGVFNDLHTLRSGDELIVEDENGKEISFVVRDILRYAPDADATDIFHSDDGQSHLQLITCEGDWNKVTQSYSKRLVVFADKK
jgi:sortase A